MLGSWSGREREVVIAGLLALLESVFVGPMTNLAWRMGQLVHEHIGLPMLGSEVVAAVERLGALLSRRATMAGAVMGMEVLKYEVASEGPVR